jgi:hypothetical protein
MDCSSSEERLNPISMGLRVSTLYMVYVMGAPMTRAEVSTPGMDWWNKNLFPRTYAFA